MKDRRFAFFLMPLGVGLIAISSLFRSELKRIFDVGATPIEVAYGVTLFLLSVYTTTYLIYRKRKQFILAVVKAIIINGFFAIVSFVAWYAPIIHKTIPFFIFERDMGLISLLFAVIASFYSSKVLERRIFTVNKKPLTAVAIIVFCSLPILGYFQYQGRAPLKPGEFTYTKDGESFAGYYDAKFLNSLNWIRTNTPSRSIFLCWWDYGHMIRGIGERGAVIYSPSEEILWSVADPSRIKEYSSHERILDVVQALITKDPLESISIMEKYGATYLFVSKDDELKAGVLSKILGEDPETYVTIDGFTEEGKKTILSKTIYGLDIEGLEMVYRDDYVSIYRLF